MLYYVEKGLEVIAVCKRVEDAHAYAVDGAQIVARKT